MHRMPKLPRMAIRNRVLKDIGPGASHPNLDARPSNRAMAIPVQGIVLQSEPPRPDRHRHQVIRMPVIPAMPEFADGPRKAGQAAHRGHRSADFRREKKEEYPSEKKRDGQQGIGVGGHGRFIGRRRGRPKGQQGLQSCRPSPSETQTLSRGVKSIKAYSESWSDHPSAEFRVRFILTFWSIPSLFEVI